MKKQFWVLCKNLDEEKELLSMLPNFKTDVSREKTNFPLIVDQDRKIIFRCTSITCCAAYVSSNNKMLTLEQFKQTFKE